ncbi:MAG: hypothetical protein M3306_07545 [Actinomycetota bacterium]|nr:hypothetical protein [Actinomycetota bacterium]
MTQQPYHVPRFYLRQKVTPFTNKYVAQAANPDGSEGQVLAFAQQKRLAFKEQVTFYADESKSQAVFAFKARAVMDLNAGYDVTDPSGASLGFFRKDFGKSLLRSTFQVEGPGYAGTGQERNQLVAILRRFTELDFLPIHFDYVSSEGQPLISIERRFAFRDKYTVTVHDPRVDFRVAAALAVAMDALMQR